LLGGVTVLRMAGRDDQQRRVDLTAVEHPWPRSSFDIFCLLVYRGVRSIQQGQGTLRWR
jgi:hypothetical protein